MKANTKLLSAALGLAALPLLFACSDNPYEPEDDAISVNPRLVTLMVGQTLRFEAYARAAEAQGRELTWQSTEPEVAEMLDDYGLVVAKAPGTTVISAGSDEFSGTAAVTVIESGGGEPENKRGREW
jgi:hypothetical protein